MMFQLRMLSMTFAIFSAALMADGQSVWNAVVGTSADTNWSDAVNWTPNGVPGSSSNVVFDSTTARTDTTINNVVDSGFGGTIASLSYSETNTGTFQNTLIAHGVTLNVTGTNGITVGFANLTSGPVLVDTISGAGGALVVNNASANMDVSLGVNTGSLTPTTTLNMTNLDTFSFTGAQLLIGFGQTRASGNLFLARTNTIALSGVSPQMNIGDNTVNGGTPSSLYLGQTNVISANSISVGTGKQAGSIIQFNPSFTNNNPVAYFRGADGVSPVATWAIGDGLTASGTSPKPAGTNDFSGGTVNIVATSMWLGRGSTAWSGSTPTASGTLTLTAGNISVNNLTNAMLAFSESGQTANGTINVNGTGMLSVGNFVMANKNGFANGTANGTLNITSGTVAVGTLTAGGGTSTINMTGGNLIVTNTVGSATEPLSSLSVNSGATLRLAVVVDVTPIAVANLSSDNSGVINISSLPNISSYPSQPVPLITYSSSGSGVTFSMGTLPGTFRGYISNDNSSMVWVVVTNGPSLSNLSWGGGVNNQWDTNSADLNWTNNGAAVKYNDGDNVTFSDQAQTTTVNLTRTNMPASVMFANSLKNYTLTGIGAISGPVQLVMNGSATNTLAESGGDNFSLGIQINNGGTIILDDTNSSISGGVTINNGTTLQIGNNDANGALPGGTLDDEGTLAYDRTNSVTVSVAIPGGGALTQMGSGTLTLSASNTFTGNTVINAGTLALTNAGSIQNSANVTVNNGGTLDVSGVTGSATLQVLALQGGASLNASVGYLQTNLNMNSLAMSGISNTINVKSLPPIVLYPATVTLLNASSGISGYNLILGMLPAASPAYGGASIAQIGNSVMLTLNSGPTNTRPFVSWSGVDALNNVNTNWSDPQNWQTPGVPIAADFVQFGDTAAASGSPFSTVGDGLGGIVSPSYINNIVGASTTISYLIYSNILSDYQNTLLGNGVTLNVISTNNNNSPLLFTVGSESVDFGSSADGFVTIAGTNGTLNLQNTNGTVFVSLGDANRAGAQATLDLSGLGTFNAAVSTFLVGVGGASEGTDGINYPSGVLYLAQTNVIKASVATSGTETSDGGATDVSIDIGDDNDNGGQTSYLYLGQTNAIYADVIGVGRQKGNGTMEFNPNLVSGATQPAAYFRGSSASAVTIWSLGDGVGNSGVETSVGTCDFTGGYVNALVSAMYVGRAANNGTGSGTATGTLNFDNGIFNVGTLYAGYQTVNGTKIGIGTINVNTNATLGTSGTLSVSGSLTLASTTGGTGAASTAGTLNISGGTVQAGIILGDTNKTGTSTINLTGGTLVVTNMAGTTGTPLTAVNLTGGTLVLDVNGSANVTNIVATTVSTSGAVTTINIASLTGAQTGVAYPLIAYTGTDPFGNLTLAPLPAGYVGSLVDNSADSRIDLVLTTVPPSSRPVITGITVSGSTLTIMATNGADNGTFILLETTNLSPPEVWRPILTNNFNNSGDLNLSTNIINPTVPQEFYILSQ